jgi:hypothetical protein
MPIPVPQGLAPAVLNAQQAAAHHNAQIGFSSLPAELRHLIYQIALNDWTADHRQNNELLQGYSTFLPGFVTPRPPITNTRHILTLTSCGLFFPI